MPLPLIPAIIIGLSALAGATGAVNTANAGRKIHAAHKQYADLRAAFEGAKVPFESESSRLQERLTRLGRLRLESLLTLETTAIRLEGQALPKGLDAATLRGWQDAAVGVRDLIASVPEDAAAKSYPYSIYNPAGLPGIFGTDTLAPVGGAVATKAGLAILGSRAAMTAGLGALRLIALNSAVAGPGLLLTGYFVGKRAERVEEELLSQTGAMEAAEKHMREKLPAVREATLRAAGLETDTRSAQRDLEHALETAAPAATLAAAALRLCELLEVKVLEDAEALAFALPAPAEEAEETQEATGTRMLLEYNP